MTEHFEREAAEHAGLFLARVTQQHREMYTVVGQWGAYCAGVSGKLAFVSDGGAAFPAVGDWVMTDRPDGEGGNAVILRVLCRKSVLARQSAGTGNAGQVIAANVDTVFICTSLNADFNVRRIERYLAAAWDSMATPVILLTKSDLCEDLPQKLREIASVSVGVDVLCCSSETENGFEAVAARIGPGKTAVFVGSSGVGKSTLINRLIGRDALATGAIRENDGRGRHTTARRQMLLLPNGGVVIDTPGMRELRIYTGNLSKTFGDVGEISARCRFRDCSHGTEPGCAIREAIASGALSEERLKSYQKLQRETSYGGLNARQLDNEKINRMFGGKSEMKRLKQHARDKRNR